MKLFFLLQHRCGAQSVVLGSSFDEGVCRGGGREVAGGLSRLRVPGQVGSGRDLLTLMASHRRPVLSSSPTPFYN